MGGRGRISGEGGEDVVEAGCCEDLIDEDIEISLGAGEDLWLSSRFSRPRLAWQSRQLAVLSQGPVGADEPWPAGHGGMLRPSDRFADSDRAPVNEW